jgi:subtilisin family serine protease
VVWLIAKAARAVQVAVKAVLAAVNRAARAALVAAAGARVVGSKAAARAVEVEVGSKAVRAVEVEVEVVSKGVPVGRRVARVVAGVVRAALAVETPRHGATKEEAHVWISKHPSPQPRRDLRRQ